MRTVRRFLWGVAIAVVVSACASAPGSALKPDPAIPEWRDIPAERLLVMDTTRGRIVIELAPDFAPQTVQRIIDVSSQGKFDNTFFYRVVEGHVAQGGIEFDKLLREMPGVPFEAERAAGAGFVPHGNKDLFAPSVGHTGSFPVGRDKGREWLLHCPGMIGLPRDVQPDSGSGDFYITLAHRRYLDRNYALFGRVISGIDHVHAMMRVEPSSEAEAEAFFGSDPNAARTLYAARDRKLSPNRILKVRLASQLSAAERPAFQATDPASAAFDTFKTSKRDYSAVEAFPVTPPKVVDICSIAVPVRPKTGQ